MEKEQQEKEALQNFATSLGLIVNQYFHPDKRKKENLWYLTKGKTSVSPVLNYKGLNNFMIGWENCLNKTAVPELLAALQKAVNYITYPNDEKYHGWVIDAENAIKKAIE
jgi:hypothetical protein